MVTCPACLNFRGVTSITYPGVVVEKELESGDRNVLKRGYSGDCTWPQFQKIQSFLKSKVSPGFPLPPACGLGLFQGKIFSKPPVLDFVLPDSSTLLARRSVVTQLNELGSNLCVFEINLKQIKGKEVDLVEVWAPPLAKSSPRAGIKWCDKCERGSRGEEILDSESFPKDQNLTKMRDEPSFFIVSEKLAENIQGLGLKGLKLETLDLD